MAPAPAIPQEPNDRWVDPVIEFYKKRVDREALRRNLRMTVQERMEQLMSRLREAEERDAAGESAPGPGA